MKDEVRWQSKNDAWWMVITYRRKRRCYCLLVVRILLFTTIKMLWFAAKNQLTLELYLFFAIWFQQVINYATFSCAVWLCCVRLKYPKVVRHHVMTHAFIVSDISIVVKNTPTFQILFAQLVQTTKPFEQPFHNFFFCFVIMLYIYLLILYIFWVAYIDLKLEFMDI